MAAGFSTSLRNARLDAITTKLDAGSTGATLKIYDGTRPATGGTATNLLATFTLPKPSASAASSALLTLNAISNATASGTGTATWARLADSNGNFVADLSVGTSGADINLNSVAIANGQTVSITSATFTEGNA